MVEELHKTCGNVDIRAPVLPARLDQYDLYVGVLTQPVGQDATRRAGTDDHIISPHARPSFSAPLFGHSDRGLAGDDGARYVQPEQRYRRGNQRAQSEGIEPAGKTARQVLRPTDEGRAKKPAEITERIDPRDPGGGRTPGQKHRRHRPEWPLGAIETDRGDRDADE